MQLFGRRETHNGYIVGTKLKRPKPDPDLNLTHLGFADIEILPTGISPIGKFIPMYLPEDDEDDKPKVERVETHPESEEKKAERLEAAQEEAEEKGLTTGEVERVKPDEPPATVKPDEPPATVKPDEPPTKSRKQIEEELAAEETRLQSMVRHFREKHLKQKTMKALKSKAGKGRYATTKSRLTKMADEQGVIATDENIKEIAKQITFEGLKMDEALKKIKALPKKASAV